MRTLCKHVLNRKPADGRVQSEIVCPKCASPTPLANAGPPLKVSLPTTRNMVGRRSQSLACPTLRWIEHAILSIENPSRRCLPGHRPTRQFGPLFEFERSGPSAISPSRERVASAHAAQTPDTVFAMDLERVFRLEAVVDSRRDADHVGRNGLLVDDLFVRGIILRGYGKGGVVSVLARDAEVGVNVPNQLMSNIERVAFFVPQTESRLPGVHGTDEGHGDVPGLPVLRRNRAGEDAVELEEL